MLTEQRNPRSEQIDTLPTLRMLEIMNAEDATVAAVVRDALPQIAEAVDLIARQIRGGGRLIYAGAGTSGRLATLDAAECVPTFGVPPEMVQALIAGGAVALTRAVEGAEDDRDAASHDTQAVGLTRQDALVGIAASGRTPYVVAALEAAQSVGAPTVGISCNRPAPLLDRATVGIHLPVGPEVIAGSTRLKAGTAQKMTLNMISTAVMIKLGKVYGNWMVDVQITNTKLAQRARYIVASILGVDEAEAERLLAASDHEVKTAIVMGWTGADAAAARERLRQADGHLRAIIGLP